MGETQEKTVPSKAVKVSVLVAVYNASGYLRQCLDSLLGQTLADLQIICIDDASSDNSLDIIKEYADADGRIEVVSLSENHGQAYARNKGLEIAKGNYICFVDSDDWIAPDCLQQAVDCFEQHPLTGCVLFDTVYVYPDRQEAYPMPAFDVMTGQAAFEASLTWAIHGVYIVKADIHKRFPYDCSARAYSDDNTTRLHYLASNEVRTCKGQYFYRQHEESVTHKPSIRRFDSLVANASMKHTLISIGADNRILDIYENVRWLNVVDSMYFLYSNKDILPIDDLEKGREITRNAWKSVEVDRLRLGIRWKFGYVPIRWSWKMFEMQEYIYFRLRNVLFRLICFIFGKSHVKRV